MVGESTPALSPIAVQILAVRASLYEAVASLERSLEYDAELLSVADAAAIVVEQVTELKRLLVLLEQDAGTRKSGRRRRSRPQASPAPAA